MVPESGTPPKRSFSFWRVALITLVVGGLCALAIRTAANRITAEAESSLEQLTLQSFALSAPSPRGLDSNFTDADQDLVADAPQESADQRSPDSLVFSFVAGPTAEEDLEEWKDFVEHLARVTGTPVKAAAFLTLKEQLAALENGTLHVTGFSTGAVPTAVASAGFVPLCTFGRDDNSFGVHMQVIVPASSPIKTLEDVKGRTVTFTLRDSNSGYKAALALLQDHDLLPQRDYLWQFSGGHEESIKGIVEGLYQVAPVASDLLQHAIAAGALQPDQIRIIYESERFPPATLGYAHDLNSALVAKIRQAFLEFDCRGTSLEKRFEDSRAARFVPLSYKQDYALVRRIDASFRSQSNADSD